LEAVSGPDTKPSLLTRPVVSWASYDLANTIFSMNVVSLYLQLWVLNTMGGTDSQWAFANSTSMALVFVSAPILGALSDQTGRRLPFLLVCTVACVVLTAFLGTPGLLGTLVLFVAANFFFQASLIFYDSLLPTVSTAKNRGAVGGFGIGVGYLGSFIGVLTGLFLLDRVGHVGVFRITALLFALFAIPIFLFVREGNQHKKINLRSLSPARAFRQVKDTVTHIRRYPGLGRFLLGRAFYTDAANTVIIFLSVYTVAEIGLTETGAQLVLLVAIVAAAIGGIVLGRVVDAVGPSRTLNLVLGMWALALLGAVLIPVFSLPPAWFWPVACLAGVALGGTWTADRPFMLSLAPADRLGEFYGLYSMVGRFAAIVGPLMWALVVDGLGWGRPAAMATLLGWILVAFLILRPLRDVP
jgi:UMF1 family MFS transporter